jgi:hypothetical protein
MWLLEARVELRCPVFGRERTQTTSLEHQTCSNGTGNQDSLSFDGRLHDFISLFLRWQAHSIDPQRCRAFLAG